MNTLSNSLVSYNKMNFLILNCKEYNYDLANNLVKKHLYFNFREISIYIDKFKFYKCYSI